MGEGVTDCFISGDWLTSLSLINFRTGLIHVLSMISGEAGVFDAVDAAAFFSLSFFSRVAFQEGFAAVVLGYLVLSVLSSLED